MGLIPGLAQWVKESGIAMRCGSDLALLWLWHRSVATAPIRPLAWEPLYAMGMAKKNIYIYIYIFVYIYVCIYIYNVYLPLFKTNIEISIRALYMW